MLAEGVDLAGVEARTAAFGAAAAPAEEGLGDPLVAERLVVPLSILGAAAFTSGSNRIGQKLLPSPVSDAAPEAAPPEPEESPADPAAGLEAC